MVNLSPDTSVGDDLLGGCLHGKTNIGLFDVEGGAATRPTRQITSPLFDRVTIRLNENYFSGKQFVITTHYYYVSI